ncbi:MAG: AAA family ATPase [Pseudodesulfovibrio sp.]|uniref:SMC domain protein n=1 Tax=Pseudodesulfovibrio aespoeensis (strain ATCC 700646 / DSM 10631 / Aspo-2) TaxID=643562 RepID=E6VR61_PSEA9|nr:MULTISPECIES: AAA family ATPase [Pseudodesulfovibrio]MBU4191551.1 AAA family ATPase [Pseudomonadota bacterium]MCG2733562.1 AAA family ATPase [Pseudodesulfovibrio aespoeensis]ADU64145.1 SMC domain protein [Pseudodesulfovibrio aespoeensis Aspo-2]MBU4243547.1 AAA family ATPase [Pseudomonadota bacterium]MBU4378787.1 AAA family ATPase [Pseudomonadota bacterium]
MKIEQIHIRNFRAFRKVTFKDLPSFCVLLGPNGSGKSTFFDVIGFLKDSLQHNVRQALQKRGGFKEVVTRGHGGEAILIEIKFRMPIGGKERLVTYHLQIGYDSELNRPEVTREILRYKRGRNGKPYHFLEFAKGSGYAVTNEEDFDKEEEALEREWEQLEAPDILAIKGVGQFQRFKAASAFRQLIESWHVSNFHINDARGSKDAGVAEHLSTTGDNLQLVAQHIYDNHPDVFSRILGKMRERVPGIKNVEATDTPDGRIVLKFQDGSFADPFVDRYVSDGTIKMFAYLVLLYDPKPHPLLCVEEPENQLYPMLLGELAEEFEEYARRGGQVFVTTHSPDFLNAVPLASIFWLEKNEGVTTVFKAGEIEQLVKLVEEGDLPGYLWKEGLFRTDI